MGSSKVDHLRRGSKISGLAEESHLCWSTHCDWELCQEYQSPTTKSIRLTGLVAGRPSIQPWTLTEWSSGKTNPSAVGLQLGAGPLDDAPFRIMKQRMSRAVAARCHTPSSGKAREDSADKEHTG
jgi:hypothetical protein